MAGAQLRSRIYLGHVTHARLVPVRHSFTYPVCFFAFDLDELPALESRIPLFGYNRPRLFSLFDSDYLRGSGSIRDRVLAFLKQESVQAPIDRIVLVTSARFFGYAFNPASFFYCYSPCGTLACVVTEVNNTFGERHLYLTGPEGGWRAEKVFHVSPFFDRTGHYQFRFGPLGERADLRIDLHREGKPALAARMTGRSLPFTASALTATLIRFPLTAFLTMPRILWQAARLYFGKGLPVYTKPEPTSLNSFRPARPSLVQRLLERGLLTALERIRVGSLELTLPDGTVRRYGDPAATLRAALQIRNPAFFAKLAAGGEVGFGEAYMDGDWRADDLTALLQLFVENRPYLDERRFGLGAGRLLNRLLHLLNRNTRARSKQNIAAHYDLSNAFFQTFLDPSMMYSCALFRSPDHSLEEAQRQKNREMIRRARIEAGDHVLEIGSGWGGFAIQAVQETGCRVTTITLSEQQFALATERVRQAGLQDRITVLIKDYREMTGRFDKIVSIEMFEAVGHEYYGTFFKAVDRLLKPDGLVAIQVITIADQRYETYRRGSDWLQKYIFPGGLVPSLTAMTWAMTRDSRLMVEELENIGIHYARTLREWRARFTANREELSRLGFDERFRRMWEYYLCYCEAGFRTRVLGTLQLVLTRPNNKRLPAADQLMPPATPPVFGMESETAAD